MKKTVVWCGPDRIIPGVGVGSKGVKLSMPPDMANSFISQGVAKSYTPKQKQLKEEK